MKYLWKSLKLAGMTLLFCSVFLLLIAEYREYVEKAELNNMDIRKGTTRADSFRV